jgi:hypothetical protein
MGKRAPRDAASLGIGACTHQISAKQFFVAKNAARKKFHA